MSIFGRISNAILNFIKMQKYLHSFLALLVAGTVGAKNISLMADPLTLTTNVTGTVCASSGIVMFLKGCPSGAAYEITNAESSVVKEQRLAI